jgi:hypothetical protein
MLTGACMMAIERHLGRKEHDLRQVMAAAVRGLDEEEFQLLESLYEDETPVLIAGHHQEMDFNEDRLRPLRNRGLIETVAEDQSVGRSFRRSRWVRLSELGKIVAEDLPTRHQ